MVLLRFFQTHRISPQLVTPPEANLFGSDNSLTSIPSSQASYACGTHYQTPSCQLQPWNPSGADWVHYFSIKMWTVFIRTWVFYCTKAFRDFLFPHSTFASRTVRLSVLIIQQVGFSSTFTVQDTVLHWRSYTGIVAAFALYVGPKLLEIGGHSTTNRVIDEFVVDITGVTVHHLLKFSVSQPITV